jgi:hypothetical protein
MLKAYFNEEFAAGSLSLQKQREFLDLQREVITFVKVPYKLEKV